MDGGGDLKSGHPARRPRRSPGRVVLDGDARPVAHRLPESSVAGATHHDHGSLSLAFPAAAGDRSDPAEAAQGVVISHGKGLTGLGEQRGEDDPSDSRQGSQDLRVTVPAPSGLLPIGAFIGLAQGIEEGVYPLLALLALAVDQPQPRRDQLHVCHGRLAGPRGDDQRWLPERREDLVGM